MNIVYELVDLGVENSQYFQGFGTSYTEFTGSVVGAGFTAREAIEDALEQVCSSTLTMEQCEYIAARVWTEVEECKLLDKTVYEYYGITEEESESEDFECDSYYYVGIRWKVEEEDLEEEISQEEKPLSEEESLDAMEEKTYDNLRKRYSH